MKKIFWVAAAMFFSFGILFAAPPRHGRDRRPAPPRPQNRVHHHSGNSGVYLAAEILNTVGGVLNVLSTPEVKTVTITRPAPTQVQTVTVQPAAVQTTVVQPAAVQTTVVQPVTIRPAAVKTVYYYY